MKRFAALALLIAGCGGGPTQRTSSEQNAPPTVPPFAGDGKSDGPLPELPPAPRELVLMAGDQIAITVYRQQDLDTAVLLPHEGTFSFPLIGQVKAAGRTAPELEKHIRERLAKDFLHDPQVIVTVKQYAARKVYAVGGVQKPGSYELPATERLTLLQFIATAGGFTDRAYKEFAQIVRRKADGEREVIRLSIVAVERAVAAGKASADPELWPDDLVVIPSAARVVYVMGAVGQSGSIDIPPDSPMTVSMAVSRAGSYTKFAATGRVLVLRHLPTGETQKFTVNLDAILGGQMDQDVELRPGDLVHVPERGIF